MPERTPERMSDKMSERRPIDLPGRTASKVFFSANQKAATHLKGWKQLDKLKRIGGVPPPNVDETSKNNAIAVLRRQ